MKQSKLTEDKINKMLNDIWKSAHVPPSKITNKNIVCLGGGFNKKGRRYYRFNLINNEYIRVYKKYGYNIKPIRKEKTK